MIQGMEFSASERYVLSIADKAQKVGVGRTFKTKYGEVIRVLAIDDRQIHLSSPGFERFTLPRNGRKALRELHRERRVVA